MRTLRIVAAAGWMVATLGATSLHAAQQPVLGKELLVRGGLSANRRLVGVSQRNGSVGTIVGDPVLSGADVTFVVNGASGSQQTFHLPPGADPPGPAPGWRAIRGGFKYSDTTLQNGPVSRAVIQRAANGTLVLKATARGATITVVPPDPGTDGSLVFEIPAGDRYCMNLGGAAGGTIKTNASTAFKIVTATAATPCQTPAGKHAFVANVHATGNLGGLAGADATCNAHAAAAGLGGTYLAWLADGTDSPSTRFTHATGPYVRVDGQIIANGWADLTDGTLAVPVVLDENGQTIPNQIVWTNVTPAGTATSTDLGQSCDNWTSSSASFGGRYGGDVSVNFAWTDSSLVPLPCNNIFGAALYCFEQ